MLIRFDMETGINKKSSCRWVKIGDLSWKAHRATTEHNRRGCLFGLSLGSVSRKLLGYSTEWHENIIYAEIWCSYIEVIQNKKEKKNDIVCQHLLNCNRNFVIKLWKGKSIAF